MPDFASLILSIMGILFMFISTTQLNEFYNHSRTKILAGFALCFFGGLSRSIGTFWFISYESWVRMWVILKKGMTKYREIKTLVHAENIVFWHAVQSCLINIPAMLIFQKYQVPDATGLKWILYLSISATSATLLSNTALQVTAIWLGTATNLTSLQIQEWSQWHKALICLLQL